MPRPRVLVLPGLGGSGPTHWQTLWEVQHGYTRVHQDDWEQPELNAWLTRLQAVVAEQTPVILVAHSLGTMLAAHFAAHAQPGQIAGALLVAPADVEDCQCTPQQTRSFAPVPLTRLGFPATLVASRNDPYAAFERAAQFASAWGAQLQDAGETGHINVESNLGSWPAGHRLLEALCR